MNIPPEGKKPIDERVQALKKAVINNIYKRLREAVKYTCHERFYDI